MIKLLLVEDDANLSYIIKSSLEQLIGGYEVREARNGEKGLKAFYESRPDIIVADIEMPVMDGMEMAKRIRQTDKEIPILFATGKTTSTDVRNGYEAGADYYIKKPFLPEELHAHIKNILKLKGNAVKREAEEKEQAVYTIGAYLFDPKHFVLSRGMERIPLTGREAGLIELLYENRGQVVKREDILKKFWGDSGPYMSRSLDVFMTKIRHYFASDPSVCIKNIKGVGIIME